VTADHGQGFMEHGFFGHGLNLHQEIVRVPLLVWSNRKKRGFRISNPVQLIDIFPTLGELLSRPPAAPPDGRSFAGCLEGVEEPGRRAICEGGPSTALVGGGKKLIVSRYRLLEPPERISRLKELVALRRFRRLLHHLYSICRAELYDLSSDPEERRNRRRSDPAAYNKMLVDLKTWQRELASAAPEVTTRELDARETIEQLKSLGYL